MVETQTGIPARKTYTVDQVLDAIEQNGLPQVRNTYFEYGTSTKDIIGACAIGQAAYNLGVYESDLRIVLDRAVPNLGTRIIRMNDNKGRSFQEIVKYYRRRLTKRERSRQIDSMHAVDYI